MGFPWKTGIFFLLVCIAGVVLYDVNLHGSFKKSTMNHILTETNSIYYVNIAWKQIHKYSNEALKWSKENLPYYYTTTSTVLKPYLQLLYDLSLIFYNIFNNLFQNLKGYLNDTIPVIDTWMQEYKVKETLVLVWESVWDCTIRTSVLAYQFVLDAGEYAKKNIFVGSMSPENLKKVTWEALNTTQVYATSTFQWVYKKISDLQS